MVECGEMEYDSTGFGTGDCARACNGCPLAERVTASGASWDDSDDTGSGLSVLAINAPQDADRRR